MTKLLKKLKNDIRKFRETGKLPREASRVYRKHGDAEGFDHDEFPSPEPSRAAVRLADAWPDALKEMPEPRRRIYQLHLVGWMNQTEVGRILGISQAMVAKHAQAIREEAKKLLAE